MNAAPWRDEAKRALAPRLLLAAIAVGAASGVAGVAFRLALNGVQWLAFGAGGEMLLTALAGVPAWRIALAPALGGLAVGLYFHFVLPGRRLLGPADVIEGVWRHGGVLPVRRTLLGAVANALSLGVGASVGREGPIVLLGGALGSGLGALAKFAAAELRLLVACGVAGCVAASFNAPLAAPIFALEVVLLTYRPAPLAALALASVAGTLVGRACFGSAPLFPLPAHGFPAPIDYPAAALLGAAAAAAALAMMAGIFKAGDVNGRLGGPQWLKTGAAGLAVGILALWVPQVLSYGQEATHAAMLDRYGLAFLLAIVAAKLAATAVSLGFGFGGGVFSPSLVLGSALGGAFGHGLALIVPGAAAPGAYAAIGAAAVSAPVLGAPVSTVLIVLEMTEAWRLAPGMAVAVLVATAICRKMIGRSFFTWQLQRRGVVAGPTPHERSVRVEGPLGPAHENAPDSSPARGER
ncbi:MAG: chloride channel protein [Candidatus Odyssella sp.]|nr:chloride channel protein [Candidatus Odyssella sp.]